ncbi:TIM21-domain-containing protein [Hesseltinella vesiculosa]|uniref:Mitochondrial import inner membrane translocase subunit Tim21 n=1 Tax=Hesseltinella vesiculosa TaxID=101127 RepID=A0A1X2GMF6_9FUNG|nr:TIM21-domain-containing protein [Hesseltinella vesiculosa]
MLRLAKSAPLRSWSAGRPCQRSFSTSLQARAQAQPSRSSKPPHRSSLISQETAKEWKDLSTTQKVAAASKASFNFTVIGVGLALTLGLVYVVGSELFGTQSSTNIFSDALERARQNEEIIELIGEPIKGHGAPSRNRMKRNRRIQYQLVNDQQGNEHLLMRFYVEGPNNEGTGMVDMIKDDKGKWVYRQLYVDVPGQGLPSRRIHLNKE